MLRLVIGCLILSLMVKLQASTPGPAVGEVPQSYLGTTTDGKEVLLEDYKGKVVVISFWASWCAPCLKELPVLGSIQQTVGQERLQVIAINYKEERSRYRKLHRTLSESMATVQFTHDPRGSIGAKFGVEGLPVLYVIDKNGKVAYHKLGFGNSSIDDIVDVLNVELAK